MNKDLNAINETIKLLATNFICFDVIRGREVNVVESILDSKEKLNWIYSELSGIRNALERIADAVETKGALGVSFKLEAPHDFANEDDDEEDDDGWAITDENGRVVAEGDYK